jgi:gas vesicle protein
MFNEERNTKIFLGGLITGGLIGGLAGIIFAPKSGRELRQDISNKGNELLEDTNEFIGNAKTKASAIISDAKKSAENLLEEGRKKLNGLTDGAENILNDGKVKVEEGVSMVKDAVKSGTEAYTQERSKLNQKNESDGHSKYSTEDKNKFNKSKA